jgi:hypothetical protein
MGEWVWDRTAWGDEAMRISLFVFVVREGLTSSTMEQRVKQVVAGMLDDLKAGSVRSAHL